ncbi:hypothetical protein LTS18_012043 [Coniosporium uncinatum]|uniref:Uncharacterized protein n=1 Tax=Coniosporium uncinatum TaxID=93489 RepID=A0ACC3DC32_9PEZI|nr:hypothetical protein LTS18_012043 [Coniosporium uncinatum]
MASGTVTMTPKSSLSSVVNAALARALHAFTDPPVAQVLVCLAWIKVEVWVKSMEHDAKETSVWHEDLLLRVTGIKAIVEKAWDAESSALIRTMIAFNHADYKVPGKLREKLRFVLDLERQEALYFMVSAVMALSRAKKVKHADDLENLGRDWFSKSAWLGAWELTK